MKGSAGTSADCASKNGVEGIMQAAAIECAPFGIRVNTVHPGLITTRVAEGHVRVCYYDTPEEGKKAPAESAPLKRYGSLEQEVALMLYLVSDESRYCTHGIIRLMVEKGLCNEEVIMDMSNLKSKVAPERSALIIIDMQKDYCSEGGIFHRMGYDIKSAKALAARLNDFLGHARKVLKNIIHVKMTKIDSLSSSTALEQYRRLGVNRQYDPAFSEFYEVLPQEGEVVIPKYRHSPFVSTYFDQLLRIRQIQTLIVTGLATNVCVESTARDGFARDYHVVIPEDLTEGTSLEAKKWSLSNINLFFGEIVQSQDLLRCWDL